MKELTPSQAAYLQERGFQIQEGRPNQNSTFPYLTLNPLGDTMGKSEIQYHYRANVYDATLDQCHPTNKPINQLVNIIEGIVGDTVHFEGKLFTTSLGTPIPIYILDPAWNNVARALEAKYAH